MGFRVQVLGLRNAFIGRHRIFGSLYGDRPKTHVYKSISTGTHDAKTLRAKARERAAKGSRKVQKPVPTTSLVTWHSWTVAHACGFFLTGSFWLSRSRFPKKKHARALAAMWQVLQLSVQKSYRYYCSHPEYHCPPISIKPLPGQMLQNGISRKARERRAEGARKERERRTWPGR